jgi:hypothetical protein
MKLLQCRACLGKVLTATSTHHLEPSKCIWQQDNYRCRYSICTHRCMNLFTVHVSWEWDLREVNFREFALRVDSCAKKHAALCSIRCQLWSVHACLRTVLRPFCHVFFFFSSFFMLKTVDLISLNQMSVVMLTNIL